MQSATHSSQMATAGVGPAMKPLTASRRLPQKEQRRSSVLRPLDDARETIRVCHLSGIAPDDNGV